MTAKPVSDLGMLMDGVIVEDRVDQRAGRYRGLDPIEKPDEFLVAMARHALADDRAVDGIECGKQRGHAVPDIIMGHCPGAAPFHRQAGLSAVERLDLRLLIDRQHQAMRRRVERARPRRAAWRQTPGPATA